MISLLFYGYALIAFATVVFYSSVGKTVPGWLVPWWLRDASEGVIRGYLRFWAFLAASMGSYLLAMGSGLVSLSGN